MGAWVFAAASPISTAAKRQSLAQFCACLNISCRCERIEVSPTRCFRPSALTYFRPSVLFHVIQHCQPFSSQCRSLFSSSQEDVEVQQCNNHVEESNVEAELVSLLILSVLFDPVCADLSHVDRVLVRRAEVVFNALDASHSLAAAAFDCCFD